MGESSVYGHMVYFRVIPHCIIAPQKYGYEWQTPSSFHYSIFSGQNKGIYVWPVRQIRQENNQNFKFLEQICHYWRLFLSWRTVLELQPFVKHPAEVCAWVHRDSPSCDLVLVKHGLNLICQDFYLWCSWICRDLELANNCLALMNSFNDR